MEKRVLLAVILSLVVLYVFQAISPKPAPKPAGTAATAKPPAAAPATPGDASPTVATPAPPSAPEPAAPTAATLVGDAEERDVRVETPNVVAIFTNRGARLKSWRLTNYKDQQNQPVELVSHDFGDAQPLPFSMSVADEAMTKRINGALFAVSGAPAGPITAPAQVMFEY